MALLRAESVERRALDDFMTATRDAALQSLPGTATDASQREAGLRVNGPLAAPMPLRAGRHREQLLLESASRPALHAALHTWLPRVRALPQPRGLRWSVDVDPVDLY
jgi:primosomal protein N' (replication factor Y)